MIGEAAWDEITDEILKRYDALKGGQSNDYREGFLAASKAFNEEFYKKYNKLMDEE